MSTFNNYRFTPVNKANLRQILNRQFIYAFYKNFNSEQLQQNINNADDITEGNLCNCIPSRANPLKQGYNDPTQSENRRLARALTGTLGGRITFGNFNIPVELGLLEGWEGQPGGLPRPLRNKF